MSSEKKQSWVLDVGVKLSEHGWDFSMDLWEKANDVVHTAVGFESSSAGTGFGVRDMQFYFDTEDDAKAAGKRVIEALKTANLELSYCSTFEEGEDEEGDEDEEA
jgi:hypothetical protein